MSEKYSTDKLIGVLNSTVTNYHAGLYPDMKYIDEGTINAIIAKLRAGDKLCYAVKHAQEQEDLDKAIAEYEGKK